MRATQSGQALLIVLLGMAVVLTIVLSILSTSITDVKVTTTEESALRAFSAAEAGVERALITGGAVSGTIGNASFNASISSYGQLDNTFIYPQDLSTGKTYFYSYFEGLIPSDVVINEITSDTVNGGDFNSGGTQSKGYVWYRKTGDLTINGNLNLTGSRKVILLVKNGNLNINGRMNIQSPGSGFIMTIVQGNITIDPSVTHPTNPSLEGLFVADGTISTGAGSNKLYVRGSLIANGGLNLQRDLGSGNSTEPAEYIEFAPDLIFTYPRNLTRARVTWREVVP